MGKRAAAVLSETNCSPDSFQLMLAASGGPRWLGLVGLDRPLAKFFRQNRSRRLPLLGASSGAWRMAAHASCERGHAYEELLHEYLHQSYWGNPSPREVSDVCRAYLGRVFTDTRVLTALDSPDFQLNLTTAILPKENPSKPYTFATLFAAFLLNMVKRDWLGRIYQRGLFSVPAPEGPSLEGGWDGLPTQEIALSVRNFTRALMASGSIPVVLEGESGIPGANPGHHLDGGLVDYHFELEKGGPIIYPHFSAEPLPGWFDRFWPHRRISQAAREQLCILIPSEETIARFAWQEFPCRQHFHKYSNDERIKKWQQTVAANDLMERELQTVLEAGELLEVAEPL